MQFTLTHIGPRSSAGDEFSSLTALYLERTAAFMPCDSASFRSEQDFLEWLIRKHPRGPILPVLLDSRGRQMTSEAFAAWLGARRDQGTRHIAFAIGPADGWSGDARAKAQLLLSFGQMTLPHSLARLVLAEQLYRACTILAGHPYHTGH
jgi:23S rRNA (pseudouridine1915-N3)-methyltransferase